MGSPGLYVLAVHPLEVMTPIAEASTVHIPTVDRSAAPASTLTTMWLWGLCHRYSSTTPRYVRFLPMSNIAREWWASVGAAARAIPTATAKASNGRRARERSEGGCFGSVSVCFSADILSIDVGRAFLTLGVFRRRACS